MNYYPYYMYYNFNMPIKQPFKIRNLFNNINFNSILNGTQKTLNIVNQAIPLIKQVSPIINNAKTMFKVMNEFKNVDNNNVNNKNVNNYVNINNDIKNNQSNPTFFQ